MIGTLTAKELRPEIEKILDVNKNRQLSEAYSEHNRTSKMELCPKIVNGFKSSTIFTNSSNLDVRLASEYASGYLGSKFNLHC